MSTGGWIRDAEWNEAVSIRSRRVCSIEYCILWKLIRKSLSALIFTNLVRKALCGLELQCTVIVPIQWRAIQLLFLYTYFISDSQTTRRCKCISYHILYYMRWAQKRFAFTSVQHGRLHIEYFPLSRYDYGATLWYLSAYVPTIIIIYVSSVYYVHSKQKLRIKFLCLVLDLPN